MCVNYTTMACSRMIFTFSPFELYVVGLNNAFSAVFSNTVCGLALEPNYIYVKVIHALFCMC